MFFITGFVNFIKNTWTGLTGADTPNFYTTKPFTNDVNKIPAAAIVVQRTNNDFVGGAIRKVTGEWGNHIKVSSGGTGTIEAESSGVVADNITKSMTSNNQMIILVKQDLTPTQQQGIVSFAQGSIGKSYNFPGILWGFLVNTDNPTNSTDFCSQLGVQSYWSQGIKISNKTAETTSPGDIAIFLIGPDGTAEMFIVWDCYNITLSDVAKTTYKLRVNQLNYRNRLRANKW